MLGRRNAWLWVAALGFGLLAGWVHGNGGGFRSALGNVSAPWLLVALLPSWRCSSALRGAITGMAATVVALVGFYVALTAAMYGHLGTTHEVVASFVLVVRANRIWFMAGLVSGSLLGGLAPLLSRLPVRELVVAVVALLLLCEWPAVTLAYDVSLLRWNRPESSLAYQLESALGLISGVVFLRRRRIARS